MQQMIRVTPEAEIISYFRRNENDFQEEIAALDAAIRNIVISGNRITTKAIILQIIGEMETTSDVIRLDVLRNVLEIVVGHTPDDKGF
ncbi:biofilm development regulator YmgB/AriR family protein [Pantoea sp. BAV 3049]|uniref:biofilm development regulator YmgB/AriR family protein n=1 Tax=Pantoea sp. BAV 3049 TaxID=2654188 RepID=UPI001E3C5C99|nr:biofilm development regulator YmgB/AriR family protein [Pantoea sp. BAV 3049]